VADNQGGGIFSFLSQASALSRAQFERFFGTPRPHNLVAVAEAFGHASATVATRGELRAAIATGLGRAGLSVVVAQVPSREENVRIHEALNLAVQGCWSAGRA
jgi:2-succinyl-5-enolpyruvyl-6-hydroxy-3-cyclohexene-1-carboxylate synthase